MTAGRVSSRLPRQAAADRAMAVACAISAAPAVRRGSLARHKVAKMVNGVRRAVAVSVARRAGLAWVAPACRPRRPSSMTSTPTATVRYRVRNGKRTCGHRNSHVARKAANTATVRVGSTALAVRKARVARSAPDSRVAEARRADAASSSAPARMTAPARGATALA